MSGKKVRKERFKAGRHWEAIARVGAVSVCSSAAFSLNAKRLDLPNPRSHLLQRPHSHCRSYVLRLPARCQVFKLCYVIDVRCL